LAVSYGRQDVQGVFRPVFEDIYRLIDEQLIAVARKYGDANKQKVWFIYQFF
jgi:hypothetical protein